MQEISITGIWLLREGVEQDPLAKAVVAVQLADGRYIRVIEELVDGSFSHHVSASGIARHVREGNVLAL